MSSDSYSVLGKVCILFTLLQQFAESSRNLFGAVFLLGFFQKLGNLGGNVKAGLSQRFIAFLRGHLGTISPAMSSSPLWTMSNASVPRAVATAVIRGLNLWKMEASVPTSLQRAERENMP